MCVKTPVLYSWPKGVSVGSKMRRKGDGRNNTQAGKKSNKNSEDICDERKETLRKMCAGWKRGVWQNMNVCETGCAEYLVRYDREDKKGVILNNLILFGSLPGEVMLERKSTYKGSESTHRHTFSLKWRMNAVRTSCGRQCLETQFHLNQCSRALQVH